MTRTEWHALVSGWDGIVLWKTGDPEAFSVGDYVALGRPASGRSRPLAGLFKIGMGFLFLVRVGFVCFRAFDALRSIKLRG